MDEKQPVTAEAIMDVVNRQRLSHLKDFAKSDDLLLLLHPYDAMVLVHDVPMVRDPRIADSVPRLMSMHFITTEACAPGKPQVLRRAR